MLQASRTPPIIGIDGSRLLIGERTGTETYTAQIIAALARLQPPETLRVYLNAAVPPPPLASPIEPVPIPFSRLWTHGRLSWEMLRRPPTVLFVPAHVVPVCHPPSVVTIHDLGYLHEPRLHGAAARRSLDWSTRWSVRVARCIIAVSETTRHDLVTLLGVPAERIRVVHHGVDAAFQPLPSAEVEAVRRRLDLPSAFVLAVGTVHPRKNLVSLARAMRAVSAAGLPHHLVVAGKRGWGADRVARQVVANGLAERVHWLGYVPAADLPALYNAADAFCFPSLWEGFGLPAVEAMACGVPSLLADRGALPEIAGDAALFADPNDPSEYGTSLLRLLTDVDLRTRLGCAGRARAATFSWDRCATDTLAVLRKALAD